MVDKIINFSIGSKYYFQRGTHFYHKNKMDKALIYYQRAIAVDPHNPLNHFNVACLLSELGKYQESSRIFSKILEEMDSENSESLFWLAMNHGQMQQYRKAHNYLKRYLERDPEGEYSWQAQEILDYMRSDGQMLSASQREKIDRLCYVGIELVSKGKLPEAIRCFIKATRIEPDLSAPRNNLALAWFYLGDINQAIQETIKALELEPDNVYANCNLAVFCFATDDELGMQRQLRILYQLGSDDPDDLIKLGTTFGLLGKHSRALRIFSDLVHQGEEGFEVRLLLAVAACNCHRRELSRELLDAVEVTEPDNPYTRAYRTRINRGNSLLPYHLKIPNRLINRVLDATALTPALLDSVRKKPAIWRQLLWIARHGSLSTLARVTDVIVGLSSEDLLCELAASLYTPDVRLVCQRGIYSSLMVHGIKIWERRFRPADALSLRAEAVLEQALAACVQKNLSFNMWQQIYLTWMRFVAQTDPQIRNISLWSTALVGFVLGPKRQVEALAQEQGLNPSSLRKTIKNFNRVFADI